MSALLLAATAAWAVVLSQDPPPPDRVESSAGALRIEQLATLEFPWGLERLPDGRVLVTEKPGRLRIWASGRLSEPVSGVPKVVYRGGESEQGGLLDVAADPDFARNRFVYLSFVEAADHQAEGQAETGDHRFGEYLDFKDTIVRGGAVARGRLDGNALRDVRVIWRQVPKTLGRGHFGHRMAFGPDGMLYLTSGDRMRFDPAQRLDSNLGKIVRIRPDGSIPPDNPFAGRADARGDLWSYGHRNVLSLQFDLEGRLWALEMGPLGGDELNRIEKGKNYGWPLVSNGDNYSGPSIPDHPTRKEFAEPLRSWTPVISPSGGTVVRSSRLPGWRGSLIVGGLSSMAIIRLAIVGDKVAVEERLPMGRRMRDVIEGEGGTLLAIVDAKQGALLRLSP